MSVSLPNRSQADTQTALIQALAGMDTGSSAAVVQRTRRVVMHTASQFQRARARRRRNFCVVFGAMAALFLLLTPAIWSGIDDFIAGEHFFDLPAMLTALILILFSAVMAVLLVQWATQQRLHRRER